jgi:hypothetical protein
MTATSTTRRSLLGTAAAIATPARPSFPPRRRRSSRSPPCG